LTSTSTPAFHGHHFYTGISSSAPLLWHFFTSTSRRHFFSSTSTPVFLHQHFFTGISSPALLH
jgi:hypothetical protein